MPFFENASGVTANNCQMNDVTGPQTFVYNGTNAHTTDNNSFRPTYNSGTTYNTGPNAGCTTHGNMYNTYTPVPFGGHAIHGQAKSQHNAQQSMQSPPPAYQSAPGQSSAPGKSTTQFDQEFEAKLQNLNQMGFGDRDRNIKALHDSQSDIILAIELLVQSSGSK